MEKFGQIFLIIICICVCVFLLYYTYMDMCGLKRIWMLSHCKQAIRVELPQNECGIVRMCVKCNINLCLILSFILSHWFRISIQHIPRPPFLTQKSIFYSLSLSLFPLRREKTSYTHTHTNTIQHPSTNSLLFVWFHTRTRTHTERKWKRKMRNIHIHIHIHYFSYSNSTIVCVLLSVKC